MLFCWVFFFFFGVRWPEENPVQINNRGTSTNSVDVTLVSLLLTLHRYLPTCYKITLERRFDGNNSIEISYDFFFYMVFSLLFSVPYQLIDTSEVDLEILKSEHLAYWKQEKERYFYNLFTLGSLVHHIISPLWNP